MPRKKKTTSKKKKTRSQQEGPPGRSLWKGYISFGLVNIPIVLYTAEKPKQEVHFKLLSKRDHAGIKYMRVNEETGEEVDWKDIVKGYEYEPGNYAILTEEDLEAIAIESSKMIEIEDFVDLDELGTMYFEKPYYVLPVQHAEKGYVLLREILTQTHKVGIARIIIRTHEYLAAILPYDNAIILNTMRFPQEIKKPSEMHVPKEGPEDLRISKKEMEIAKQLVDSMTVKWDPQRYDNVYRDELMKIIEEKVSKGGEKHIKHVEKTEIKKTNVIDFMAMLKKSVKQKKGGSKAPAKTAKAKKKKTTSKKKGTKG